MATLTYAEILEKVKSEGGIDATLKDIGTATATAAAIDAGVAVEAEGSEFSSQDLVGRSIEIEVEQLPVIDFPMEDQQFSSKVSKNSKPDLNTLLSLKNGMGGKVNNYQKGYGQVIINSSRLVFNASRDFLMMFGKEGVAIASPGPVNLDSEKAITLFGENGLFLGVPNKGEEIKDNIPKPRSKGDATPNQEYEPLVLGIKLANILEDLIYILKNANIIVPVGKGYFLEDTQWELASLAARIPEMLSTYAYVDGISHNKPDPPPPAPDKITPYPTRLVGVITALGDSQLSNTTSNSISATQPITSPLESLPGFYEGVDLYTF